MENRRGQYTLIRHAESLYNKNGVSGRDPELSEAGRACASELSGDYDYALVSCMRRARETFLYAPDLNATIVEYSSLCREKMSSGHSKSNLMEGEESINEDEEAFEFRMQLLKKFLRYKAKQHDYILVVCHSGVIEALIGERAANGEAFIVNELD